MRPFRTITGSVAPLNRADVDTDQIIPKQFLKRVERTGYGDFLFFDWRVRPDGAPNPDFVLNQAGYSAAPILVAGANFGCGSSREHAAWALGDFGIRSVIAPTFADIFLTNCYQNGLLPVQLADHEVSHLMSQAQASPGYTATVDLENCTVTDNAGFLARFQIDPFRRKCLLEGLDDIGLTMKLQDRIEAFEALRKVPAGAAAR
ncbi:MAG: 3-isopropylmalate dehydratase small subunit [Gemmatimonadota bacterium]